MEPDGLRVDAGPLDRTRLRVSTTSRYRGSMLGLAVGDAVGTTVELARGQTDMIRVHSGSERRLSRVSIIGSPPFIGLALYGLSSTA